MKRLILFFILLFGFSCSKEIKQEEIAVVNIIVGPTRNLSGAEVPAVDRENRITTLRVILCQGGKIIRNEFHDFTSEPEAASRNIQIMNVPVGPTNFYFLANESAMGHISWSETEEEQILNKVVLDEGKKYPVNTLSESSKVPKALPMSGILSGINVQKGMEDIHADLIRDVMKIRLSIENSRETDLNVHSIFIPAFFWNQMYLFPENEKSILVSEGGMAYEILFSEAWNIPVSARESLIIYAYPTDMSTQEGVFLSILIQTADISYGPKEIMGPEGIPISSIGPNTQLNILVRISQNATIHLEIGISDWEQSGIEIPPFKNRSNPL